MIFSPSKSWRSYCICYSPFSFQPSFCKWMSKYSKIAHVRTTTKHLTAKMFEDNYLSMVTIPLKEIERWFKVLDANKIWMIFYTVQLLFIIQLSNFKPQRYKSLLGRAEKGRFLHVGFNWKSNKIKLSKSSQTRFRPYNSMKIIISFVYLRAFV